MISMTLPQYRRHECTIDGRTVRLHGTGDRLVWCSRNGLNRELLALLLVSPPGRFLGSGTLIEALWPDDEPDWAEGILRRRVFILRNMGVLIETHYCFGYRIPLNARETEQMRLAA